MDGFEPTNGSLGIYALSTWLIRRGFKEDCSRHDADGSHNLVEKGFCDCTWLIGLGRIQISADLICTAVNGQVIPDFLGPFQKFPRLDVLKRLGSIAINFRVRQTLVGKPLAYLRDVT